MAALRFLSYRSNFHLAFFPWCCHLAFFSLGVSSPPWPCLAIIASIDYTMPSNFLTQACGMGLLPCLVLILILLHSIGFFLASSSHGLIIIQIDQIPFLRSSVEDLHPSASTSHYAQALSNIVGAQIFCLWMMAFTSTFHGKRRNTFKTLYA
jgi:hypothetical protein